MVNSVRLSVCHTFFTMFASSYHHEFLGVITNDQSEVHAKGQGHRSMINVTKVKTKLNRFRTVNPVWIHMLLRRGALYCFSRSSIKFQGYTAKKNLLFGLKLGVSGLSLRFDSPMATKWCSNNIEEVPYGFSKSYVKSSILTRIEHFRTVT